MKLDANLNTNVHNMRKQREGLLVVISKAQAAVAELDDAIAASEAWASRVKAKIKETQSRLTAAAPKYPPWVDTAERQARYRKQMARDARAAERAEVKRQRLLASTGKVDTAG